MTISYRLPLIRLAQTLVIAGSLTMTAAANPPAASADEPGVGSPDGRAATLVVFNDSGRTLIGGKQKVKDNGRTLVELPRQTYRTLTIEAGLHELQPSHVRKPKLRLDVEAGRTYYVVVAYRPERSYAAPFAGSSMLLTRITEDEARSLMREMRDLTPGS